MTEQMVGCKVDAVWDTQSLVSINPRYREIFIMQLFLFYSHLHHYIRVNLKEGIGCEMGRNLPSIFTELITKFKTNPRV